MSNIRTEFVKVDFSYLRKQSYSYFCSFQAGLDFRLVSLSSGQFFDVLSLKSLKCVDSPLEFSFAFPRRSILLRTKIYVDDFQIIGASQETSQLATQDEVPSLGSWQSLA